MRATKQTKEVISNKCTKKREGIYNFFKPKELIKKKKLKFKAKHFALTFTVLCFCHSRKKNQLLLCRGVSVFSHSVLVTKELLGYIIIFLSF